VEGALEQLGNLPSEQQPHGPSKSGLDEAIKIFVSWPQTLIQPCLRGTPMELNNWELYQATWNKMEEARRAYDDEAS